MPVFIRFVDARGAGRPELRGGIFHTAYDVKEDPEVPDWLADAISREIRWFCDWLDEPERLGISTRRYDRSRDGRCWFVDTAREHVSRARGLAALLEEAGRSIDTLYAEDPGDIVWRDAHQIVAMPRRNSRRLLH